MAINKSNMNDQIQEIRFYFYNQLKKNMNTPLICAQCKKKLEITDARIVHTDFEEWILIRDEIKARLNVDHENFSFSELWNDYEIQFTQAPHQVFCDDCSIIISQQVRNKMIFAERLPFEHQRGIIKSIFRKDPIEIQRKILDQITSKLIDSHCNQEYFQNLLLIILNIESVFENLDFEIFLENWILLFKNTTKISKELKFSLLIRIINMNDERFLKKISDILSNFNSTEIDDLILELNLRSKKYTWLKYLSSLSETKIEFGIKIFIVSLTMTKIIAFLREKDSFSIRIQNLFFDSLGQEKNFRIVIGIKKQNQLALYNQIPEHIRKIVEKSQVNIKNELDDINFLLKEYQQNKIDCQNITTNSFYLVALKLVQSYRKIIQNHINNYKTEFITFFSKIPSSLVGFDTESVRGKLICVLGISINPDLSFRLANKVLNNIYQLNSDKDNLLEQFKSWLKEVSGQWVMTHGHNPQESRIIRSANCLPLNTYKILSFAKRSKNMNVNGLNGVGLIDFENLIHFQRHACHMLKHKVLFEKNSPNFFFDSALISLESHLKKKSPRLCQICNKPQDILLYCLEDAFVTILIFVWFFNRGILPESMMNTVLKKNAEIYN